MIKRERQRQETNGEKRVVMLVRNPSSELA
jgi:hypothetical protein